MNPACRHADGGTHVLNVKQGNVCQFGRHRTCRIDRGAVRTHGVAHSDAEVRRGPCLVRTLQLCVRTCKQADLTSMAKCANAAECRNSTAGAIRREVQRCSLGWRSVSGRQGPLTSHPPLGKGAQRWLAGLARPPRRTPSVQVAGEPLMLPRDGHNSQLIWHDMSRVTPAWHRVTSRDIASLNLPQSQRVRRHEKLTPWRH